MNKSLAFPAITKEMTSINTGGLVDVYHNGLTKREYFAGLAMQGLLANPQMEENEVKLSNTALDAAVEFIGDNLDPDDVFTDNQLKAWAERNGFTKE